MKVESTLLEEFIASPRGEFPLDDAGIVQVNDQIALRTQCAGIAASLVKGRPVELDEDHASAEGRDYKPLGYVNRAEVVDAGLLVKVAYTDYGIETLRLGGARRISPTYDQVENLGGNRVRPINVHSIGVVVKGNMEVLPALLNRTKERGLLLNRAMGLELPQAMNLPEEAGRLVTLLINRDKSGRSFDEKWSEMRALEPGLFVLMARMTDAEAHTRLLNRRTGHAAALAGRRYGALMNRARALEGIPEAELDRVIRQREPEVFAAMQLQHERRKSNFPLHTPSWSKHIQQSLAREAAKMPGASFEQIWEAWKKEDLDSFEVLVALID